MKRNIWIIAMACLSLVACGGNKKDQVLDIGDLIDDQEAGQVLEISEETLNEIIQSVPSPIELAAVISGSGAEFDGDLLNPVSNRDLYVNDYEKAFNIGIYSGDLGYINMYGKSYLALNYLGAIKELADGLKVGHFFDFQTIKRLAANSDKIDSLLYISTSNFNKMDNYLREQKRVNLSTLILAGSWLEGLHLISQIVRDYPSDDLIERIGEQKVILDQIMVVLEAYSGQEYFAQLAASFGDIKKVYDQVSIEYIYQEPETREVDGRLVIINNSTTEVIIHQEQIDLIRDFVEKARQDLIIRL